MYSSCFSYLQSKTFYRWNKHQITPSSFTFEETIGSNVPKDSLLILNLVNDSLLFSSLPKNEFTSWELTMLQDQIIHHLEEEGYAGIQSDSIALVNNRGEDLFHQNNDTPGITPAIKDLISKHIPEHTFKRLSPYFQTLLGFFYAMQHHHPEKHVVIISLFTKSYINLNNQKKHDKLQKQFEVCAKLIPWYYLPFEEDVLSMLIQEHPGVSPYQFHLKPEWPTIRRQMLQDLNPDVMNKKVTFQLLHFFHHNAQHFILYYVNGGILQVDMKGDFYPWNIETLLPRFFNEPLVSILSREEVAITSIPQPKYWLLYIHCFSSCKNEHEHLEEYYDEIRMLKEWYNNVNQSSHGQKQVEIMHIYSDCESEYNEGLYQRLTERMTWYGVHPKHRLRSLMMAQIFYRNKIHIESADEPDKDVNDLKRTFVLISSENLYSATQASNQGFTPSHVINRCVDPVFLQHDLHGKQFPYLADAPILDVSKYDVVGSYLRKTCENQRDVQVASNVLHTHNILWFYFNCVADNFYQLIDKFQSYVEFACKWNKNPSQKPICFLLLFNRVCERMNESYFHTLCFHATNEVQFYRLCNGKDDVFVKKFELQEKVAFVDLLSKRC